MEVVRQILDAPPLDARRSEMHAASLEFTALRDEYMAEETACTLCESVGAYFEDRRRAPGADAARLSTLERETAARVEALKVLQDELCSEQRANRQRVSDVRAVVAATVDAYRSLHELHLRRRSAADSGTEESSPKLGEWYEDVLGVLTKLTGLSILYFDADRLHLQLVPRGYDGAAAGCSSDYLISVRFAPGSTRVAGIKVMPADFPTADIVSLVSEIGDLPIFLQEFQCRIGNYMKRALELRQLDALCDVRAVGDGLHYVLSRREDGAGVTVQVDHDYPRPHSKPRIVECDPVLVRPLQDTVFADITGIAKAIFVESHE